ncbi:LysR family transcriptional regulator, partial [Xanthomonas oryzae pv. oryzae]
LARMPLLRSYRLDEWPQWFRAANVTEVPARGTMFDSSLTLASAAAAGIGVALLPLPMFRQDLDAGRLVCPFPITIDAGRYWLTRLRSRPESDAGRRLRDWLLAEQQINS